MNQDKSIKNNELLNHIETTYSFERLKDWEICKITFKSIIPDPFYSHFIEPLYAFYDKENNIILYTINEKLQKHIEIRYNDIIKSLIYNFYKNTLEIKNILFFSKEIKVSSQEIIHHTSKIYNNVSNKDIWDINIYYPDKKNYQTLTNLIQLEKYFRPIFIYGPSGCGKTSLAKIWKEYHKDKVYYTTIPNFISNFVSSIKKRNSIEWIEKIKSHPILIIDDFQLLKSTALKCQEEIRNLIDYFKDNNKIFIVLSDRDFYYLKLEKDLKSRMMTFYKISLDYPDFNTKIQIIENYCKIYNIQLEKKIIEHLAIKLNSDVRFIQSSIEKLALYHTQPSQLKLQEIDLILKPFYYQSRNIDISTIVQVVCERYNISREDILSNKRNKQISFVRHLIAYIAVKIGNYTLSYVAKYLNKKDHTGILYATKKIEETLKKDLFLKQELQDIKSLLYNHLKESDN